MRDLRIKRGLWWHSRRLIELKTARAWHVPTPGAWDSLPDEDRAQMMALSIAEGKIAAWERQQQEREIRRMKRRQRGTRKNRATRGI